MEAIYTKEAPGAIGPYSQGQQVGNLIFFSGQIPLDPRTGEIVGEEIKGQTEQVLKNIAALLKAKELTFENVVKTTCFMKNIADFNDFNEVYGKAFSNHKPARSAVEVGKLPKDVLIEIECIAEIK